MRRFRTTASQGRQRSKVTTDQGLLLLSAPTFDLALGGSGIIQLRKNIDKSPALPVVGELYTRRRCQLDDLPPAVPVQRPSFQRSKSHRRSEG